MRSTSRTRLSSVEPLAGGSKSTASSSCTDEMQVPQQARPAAVCDQWRHQAHAQSQASKGACVWPGMQGQHARGSSTTQMLAWPLACPHTCSSSSPAPNACADEPACRVVHAGVSMAAWISQLPPACITPDQQQGPHDCWLGIAPCRTCVMLLCAASAMSIQLLRARHCQYCWCTCTVRSADTQPATPAALLLGSGGGCSPSRARTHSSTQRAVIFRL